VLRARISRGGGWRLAALVFVLVVGCAFHAARADDAGRPMQLEVILNEQPTKLIGSFVMLESNRLAATRQELQDLGLNPRGGDSAPDKVIVLDDVSGVSYRYEEATQRILITAPEEQLVVKEYDLRGPKPELERAKTDWGGVVNYNVFTSGVSSADARPLSINGIPISINGIPTKFTGAPIAFNGASATFDARVFTPFGTLSQSAILRTSLSDRFDALRLNTTMSYSDPDTMMSYRAGDVIGGGFAWTRPIRIGGLQMQRNFGLRPDLVTLPLPAARGSAAVPSVADVYINNVKTYSQDVGAGPYLLSNMPAITGPGSARVVLRDS